MNDQLFDAIQGFYAQQAQAAEPSIVGSETSWRRPIASDALAVHPKQAQAAEEAARRRGVPTQFLADGRPVLTSRAHRRAYLKAYNFHDRDGGYGDC